MHRLLMWCTGYCIQVLNALAQGLPASVADRVSQCSVFQISSDELWQLDRQNNEPIDLTTIRSSVCPVMPQS